jgi:hypothetical protein
MWLDESFLPVIGVTSFPFDMIHFSLGGASFYGGMIFFFWDVM